MSAPEPTVSSICVIEPERKGLLPDFAELWRYRGLFWVMAVRDITARYKQTYFGVVWSIITPFIQAGIFWAIASLLGVTKTLADTGVPFIITAFCGTWAWQIFSSSVNTAGGSIGGAAGMIKKVYFPRLIVPMSSLVRCLVDSGITFGVLITMMVGFHVWGGCDFTPTWRLLFLPVCVAFAVLTAFSFGIWISCLTARWRDIGALIPFCFQFWQYASPVAYESSTVVPNQEKWQKFLENHQVSQWMVDHHWGALPAWVGQLNPKLIYGLNPLAGVIEGIRWSLFQGQAELNGHAYQTPGPMMLVSFVVVLGVLFSGLWFFKKTERTFVDIL